MRRNTQRFNGEKLDVSFLKVFSIIKLFEDDIPPLLKISVCKKILGWKTEEAFVEWLEYIKGKQKNKPTSDKVSLNIPYDISRIRNSVLMLWQKDLYKDNIVWLEALDLIGDCVLMDTPMAEIIKIRTYDLSSIKDPKQKYSMMKAKSYYALPIKHTGKLGSTDDLFRSLISRAKEV